MKKILVTGSNGFIAKHVILELYKKNYSVIGTVRNLDYSDTIKNDIETHLGKSIDIEFVKADLNLMVAGKMQWNIVRQFFILQVLFLQKDQRMKMI